MLYFFKHRTKENNNNNIYSMASNMNIKKRKRLIWGKYKQGIVANN